jgi:hypothetical protein
MEIVHSADLDDWIVEQREEEVAMKDPENDAACPSYMNFYREYLRFLVRC